MPSRTLTDEARRTLALFEEVTDVAAIDCVIDEEFDRAIVLVEPADMAQAIGPGGQNVEAVEEELGRPVKLVEDADAKSDFVANALAPAAVLNVTVSENDDTVAYAEVAEADVGVAIGEDGRNIEAARRMARRHHDLDGVELA